jgi:hypothetical protein
MAKDAVPAITSQRSCIPGCTCAGVRWPARVQKASISSSVPSVSAAVLRNTIRSPVIGLMSSSPALAMSSILP